MKNAPAAAIDELMEQASRALVQTDYFQAEALCLRALRRAAQRRDYERLARICLPLQESRRQRRHTAIDSGFRAVVSALPDARAALAPGLYLLQPPMLGVDTRRFREVADRRRVPAMVLCREPMTRAEQWPVVAVTEGTMLEMVTVRVRVAPPPGTVASETGPTRDNAPTPPAEWFIAAQEALGDAAIAMIKADDHPYWRVDDLLAFLDAVPDHEKLIQALADTCREAALVAPPEKPRRKAPLDNPRSF